MPRVAGPAPHPAGQLQACLAIALFLEQLGTSGLSRPPTPAGALVWVPCLRDTGTCTALALILLSKNTQRLCVLLLDSRCARSRLGTHKYLLC